MQNGESKEITLPKTTPIEDIVLDVDQFPAPILSLIGDYIAIPEILLLGNQFFRAEKPLKSPFYQMTARKYKDLTGDFQEWWDLIGAELTAMKRKEAKIETKSDKKAVPKKDDENDMPKSGRELLEELFERSVFEYSTIKNKIAPLLPDLLNPKRNAMVAVFCHFRPQVACSLLEERLLIGDEKSIIRDSLVFLKNHVPLPINEPGKTKYFTLLVGLVRNDENLKEAFLKNRHLQPNVLENIVDAIKGEEKAFWDLFDNLVSQEQLGLNTTLASRWPRFLIDFKNNFLGKSKPEQCSFLCTAIDMASTRYDWLLLFLKGQAFLPTPPKKAKYLGAEQSPEEKHFNELLQIACNNALVLEALCDNWYFPDFFNECLRLANDSLGQATDSLSLALEEGIANLYVKFVIAVLNINNSMPLRESIPKERFMQLVNASPEVRTALAKRKENRDILIQYLAEYSENSPFIEMIILLLSLRTTLPGDDKSHQGGQLVYAAYDDRRVLKALLQYEDGKRWLLTTGMEKDSTFDAQQTSLQHYAANNGNLEVLMVLVEHLPIDLNAQAGSFVTPLASAVLGLIVWTEANDPRAEKCFKVINYLLDQGVDLNALMKDGLSVLGLTAIALPMFTQKKDAVIQLLKLFIEKGAIWNGIETSETASLKVKLHSQALDEVCSEQDTQGFSFLMNHPIGRTLRDYVDEEECKAIFSKITRKEEKGIDESKRDDSSVSLQLAIESDNDQEFRRVLNTTKGEILALHSTFEFTFKGLKGQRFPLLHGLIHLLELENMSFKRIAQLKTEFPKLFAVLLTSRMAENKTPLYYLLERGVSLSPQWVLNVLKFLLSGDGKKMINVADTEKNLTPWLLCARLPCGAKCVQSFIDQGVRFVFPKNFYSFVMDDSQKESKVTKQQLQDYCVVIFKHLKATVPAKEFLGIAQTFLAISTSLSFYELTRLCVEEVRAQDNTVLLNKSIRDASPLARAIVKTLEPYVLQPSNLLLQDQINSFRSICLLIAKGANLNARSGPLMSDSTAAVFWGEQFSSRYEGWREDHKRIYQIVRLQPVFPLFASELKIPELQPPAGYTWERAAGEATDEVIFYHLAKMQVQYDQLTDQQREAFDKLFKERFANYQADTKQRVDTFAGGAPTVCVVASVKTEGVSVSVETEEIMPVASIV